MKRPAFLIILIGIIIAGLTIVQINVGNQISTAGEELSKLQQQVNNYERENTVLQEKILDAESYTNISKKAEKLGYAPSISIVNLAAPLPLAMKR